jgi:hypothetical protein
VKRARTKLIEGVPYRRYAIRYRLADGTRRRMVRWSPGFPWIREEIARELLSRYDLEDIAPGSVTINPAP